MKLIGSLSRTLALTLLVPALNVAASELESALKQALDAIPADKSGSFEAVAVVFNPTFQLFKHNFSVQPVEFVEEQKGKHTLTGKLSHITDSGKADDIAYRIAKEKGVIKEITLRVNGGKWTPLSDAMTKALGDHRKSGPMSEETQRAVERALEAAVDQSWQRAAEFLIAHIAIRHC